MAAAKSSSGGGLPGRLGSATLASYLNLVRRTSTVRSEPADLQAYFDAHGPVIYALWHGQFAVAPAIKPARLQMHAMVARHEDAELLAGSLERFGISLIRGAGAGQRGGDKGGAAALRAALRSLADGVTVAMTADVPPGPARRVGEGLITLARMSGRPIVCGAVASSRYLALDTWSRMTINLPASVIGACLSEPIWIPRTLDAAELETWRLRVETEMNRVTARAYELAGRNACDTDPVAWRNRPRPPGKRLKLYAAAARLAGTVAPLMLRRRAARGKEDPAREGERLGFASEARPGGPLAWFHAASVGELNAILPVINKLCEKRIDLSVLVTTGTVTSATLAAARLGPRAIHQFVPLDSPSFVLRFLGHWRPDLAVLTESEIWPNTILAIDELGIPSALVNGRMSKKSYRFWQRSGRVGKALFSRFDRILAQTPRLAIRFERLGARHAVSTGNLKFDAMPLPAPPDELAAFQAAIGNRPALLAASTHPGEDERVLDAWARLQSQNRDLLLIIVPRHPSRGEQIAELVRQAGYRAAQRAANEALSPDCQVYIADTLGELGLFYRCATLAFIGGSLVPHGGQNPIEAIKCGCPVITGPQTHNFKEVYEALTAAGGAVRIADAPELARSAERLLRAPEERSDLVRRAESIVAAHTGAVDRTVYELLQLLPVATGLPSDEPQLSGGNLALENKRAS